MGEEIGRESFSDAEVRSFRERLRTSLEILETLLARPQFGVGHPSLGAELELALVDSCGLPLPLNRAVLAETLDPRFTVELDRFNLECNLRPTELSGAPFEWLRNEFEGALGEIGRAAAKHGGRVVPIGILPTLSRQDLHASAMTDSARYRVLSQSLRRLRTRPFEFRIDGPDPLHTRSEDVTFEGAATSLQVHLRVDPDRFANVFNAAQLVSAPALALSGNSPTFLGHRLWDETRIALFKQAVDDRTADQQQRHTKARVAFGSDWVREGALELFAEACEHEILLPVASPETDLRAPLDAGEIPTLSELRLHQGTVWSWNRPVFDAAGGGHLRIELRMLPAGPSVADMLANVAFLVGSVIGLASEMPAHIAELPFERVESNFYRAAQTGIQAELWWPNRSPSGPVLRRAAVDIALELIPVAREGLRSLGVHESDFSPWLEIFEARCLSGQTGARWQRESLHRLEALGLGRDLALRRLLSQYQGRVATGEPVHTWPIDPEWLVQPDEPSSSLDPERESA